MDWQDKPMRVESDGPGTVGLFIVLNGYDHDHDHGVRIYGPDDEEGAQAFLETIAALWNDTARMRHDSSQEPAS